MADTGPRDWVDVLAQPVHQPTATQRTAATLALTAAAARVDGHGDLPAVLAAAGLT